MVGTIKEDPEFSTILAQIIVNSSKYFRLALKPMVSAGESELDNEIKIVTQGFFRMLEFYQMELGIILSRLRAEKLDSEIAAINSLSRFLNSMYNNENWRKAIDYKEKIPHSGIGVDRSLFNLNKMLMAMHPKQVSVQDLIDVGQDKSIPYQNPDQQSEFQDLLQKHPDQVRFIQDFVESYKTHWEEIRMYME